MKNVVEVHNLVKKYGSVVALDHFNLEVKKGEVLGLLGPNGSGKTTAIHCILALLTFQEGTITLFGKEMHPDAYDIKRKIGIVPQNVAVFNELTVYENIHYFCGLYIKDDKECRALVEEALDFVGLKEFQKFYPKKLSGGLLRRLNIACGIAHKPELIILDEPTVAVDPQSRNHILEGIEELNKRGATIIYTTHYMEEVEQLCSRIVIMDKGKSVAEGTKDQLTALVEQGEKITIEIPKITKQQIAEIAAWDTVKTLTEEEDKLHIVFEQGNHNLAQLLDYLKKQDLVCEMVYSEQPTLNDVFLNITGKELRD